LDAFVANWQTGARIDDCIAGYVNSLISNGFSAKNAEASGPAAWLNNDGLPALAHYKISGCLDLNTFDR
jgi:hypothetical protein